MSGQQRISINRFILKTGRKAFLLDASTCYFDILAIVFRNEFSEMESPSKAGGSEFSLILSPYHSRRRIRFFSMKSQYPELRISCELNTVGRSSELLYLRLTLTTSILCRPKQKQRKMDRKLLHVPAYPAFRRKSSTM